MAPKSAGSVGSYGQSSDASSAQGSEIGVLRDDAGGGDLLSTGKRSRKEAFFSVMYFIFEGRQLEADWRFLLLSTLYMWAQLLNLLFGPNFFGWDVDWNSNWWRFYKRLLLSNAAVERGWGVYVGVVLVFIIASILAATIPAWLNHYMKTRTKFRWKWPGHLLRIFVSIVRVFQISFISLLTVSFTCNNDSDRTLFFFPGKVGSYLMRLNVAFFNFLLTSYYLYITIRRAPMHRTWLNCVNAFLAVFPWWAASLAFIGVFYHEYWPRLTVAFLAGMFPLGFACAGITYWRMRFIWDVAERFKGWTPRMSHRETYRFWDEYEVEMVARVCRTTVKTDQLDIVPDPYYTSLADKVVQAGLLQFPNSAFLNLVYASLQAVLLNDPSGGLPQLQKAKKCGDLTWVQRFQVYVREQEKLAQKGRDADQSVTFDAATWSEFSASYKAAIRSHRNALGTLKAFWRLMLRADVGMPVMVRHFLRIPASKDAAEHSYKTLMERYPNNPKVMRAYSRFLQQVKNDPSGATRYAALANKAEEQQEESWREIVFGQLIDRKYLDDKSTRIMAMIDETLDAVVMINCEGMIQHVNQPALKLFGYRKGEAEGCNISALMPAPISQQHDCAECFLGVIKPLNDESTVATAYCTASGTVVCTNLGFNNLLAHQSTDIIGRPFAELTTTPDRANEFGEELTMDVVGRKAGTENVTILVLELSNVGNAFTGLITVSKATGRITYANASFSDLVGVPADQLIKMRLHEILAEPYAMLHQRWIKGRGFKHGSSGKAVTALLEIAERSTDQGNVFNVKVAPVKDNADKEWSRLSLTVAQDGFVIRHTGKLALFGLEKEVLVGKGLDVLLDVYRKEGEELAATHAKLLRDWHNQPRCLRVAVAPRGKRTVPAVLEVELPSEEAQGAFTTMHLYRADCLEGVIELDAGAKVKRVNAEAGLLFGVSASSLVGENIQKVLPKVCPGGRATELLAAHGQRGGSKQKIGAPQAAEGVHPDKHALHVSLQAAESTERPGRYLVRITVPKPVSAYSTMNNQGTHAHGMAAEVLSSLSFPYTSRFAIQKAQVDESDRPVSAQTDSTAAAAAVAASACAAAIAAADGSRPVSARTDTTLVASAVAASAVAAAVAAVDGRQPVSAQTDTASVASVVAASAIAAAVAAVDGRRPVSARTDATATAEAVAASAVAAAVAAADAAIDQTHSDASNKDMARDPQVGSKDETRVRTSQIGGGLVYGHRPDGSHNYDQPTAALRFKQLSASPLQQQQAAPSDAGLGAARPQSGETQGSTPTSLGSSTSGPHPPVVPSPVENGLHAVDTSLPAGQQQAPALGLPIREAMVAEEVGLAPAAGLQLPEPGTETGMRPEQGEALSLGGVLVAGQQAPAMGMENVMQLPQARLSMATAPAMMQAGSPVQGQSAARSMTASKEEGDEGGAEEEVDPAELAAKMDGVRAWLEANAAAPHVEAELTDPHPPGPSPTGAAVLGMPALAFSVPRLVAASPDPAGQLDMAPFSTAATAQPLQLSGDRAPMERNSMGGSNTGSTSASDADSGGDYSRLRRYKKAYKLLNSVRARQAINRLRIHLRLVLLVLVAAHVAFFAAALIMVNSCTGYISDIDSAESTTAAATVEAYEKTMLNISVYLDIQPHPMSVTTQMSLWDAVQRLVNAFKDVAAMTQEQWYNLESSFSYRFGMDNGPATISQELLNIVDLSLSLAVERVDQVARVTWIFLGIEAGLLIPLCAIYVFRLLHQVAVERFNLFSIFFFVPRPAMLALARAEIVVDELDDSDDDEEEMGAGVDSAGASGPVTTAVTATSKAAAQKAAQKRLTISRRPVFWLMLPFALWLGLACLLWTLQVLAKFPSLPFNGVLFSSVPFNKLLYDEQCLREDKETCLTKDDIDYWTTNMGLNTLMYYYLEQAYALAVTNSTDIHVGNPSMKYILAAAPDAEHGLEQSHGIFMYMANFTIVRAMQGVVLAFILVGSVAYLYLMALPFVRLALLESRKVAEVLSYLPPGVDIAALLEVANVSVGSGSTGGQGAAKRTSTQSLDAEMDA
ncbi:hypothetical protein N2152v2_006716 [Parachlorella kessleri]